MRHGHRSISFDSCRQRGGLVEARESRLSCRFLGAFPEAAD
jgi:hypothetical protein